MTISARPIVPLPRLTYQDAEQRYGPQTKQIEDLLSYAVNLTAHEEEQLTVACRLASAEDARFAAWEAAWDAQWEALTYATREAAGETGHDPARNPAWVIIYTTITALVARDLITTDGFTQEHYNTLTWPWRAVVGRIHPDDVQLTPKQRELGLLMLPTWEHTIIELIETLLVLN